MHGILADRERGLCGDEERSGFRIGGNAEHVRTSEAEDGSQPPCGCWESNLGPLQEQLALLTAEPYLQPHRYAVVKHSST